MATICTKAALLVVGALVAGGCEQRLAPQPDDPPDNPPTTSAPSQAASPADSPETPANLLAPEELVYRGAFRLPEGSGGSNWEYSGYAMTYFPGGDPDGPDDGYSGSLFAVGHDHHQMVSEIGIPAPVVSAEKDLKQLPTATTIQPFHDIRGGFFGPLEIPRAGLEYLPGPGAQDSGRLHFCWGQHNEDERAPTHGRCVLDLARPNPSGPWYIGNYTNYVTNDYLFEIPAGWANAHTPGLRLATGRFRDGTWGGLGPALLACGPASEANSPAARATLRNVKPLLLYGTPVEGSPELQVDPKHKMKNFREADEWSGGAWLTRGNKSAVVLVGTKATGKSWYGFSNGVVYPTSGEPGEVYPEVPPWPHDARGWWSEGIAGQMIFYNPDELAAVAAGKMKPWQPQPYAALNVDRYLFKPGFDYNQQKRYLLGAAAFDRRRGILYLVERRADGDKSLIHVFAVQ